MSTESAHIELRCPSCKAPEPREIRTALHIASQDGELLLFHGRMPPDAMRQSFPRLVSRFPQE
ncbi:MAG TPA: hypothetical protein VMA76_06525 [Solirubrobacteraceae bacterium]|nr:hypothetical protein [Solirubrobacteraceae bacterium]